MRDSRVAENKGNRVLDGRGHLGTQCLSMTKLSIPEKVGIRPTAEDHKLIVRLCAKLGVDKSQIIRIALRRLAEFEGLQLKAS